MSSSAPTQVLILSGVAQVSLGSGHSCARLADSSAWCWGSNDHGQLGIGNTVDQPMPTQVASLGFSVAEIAAGGSTSCARLGGGSLSFWGRNTLGEVGDGTTIDRTLPVQISTLSEPVLGVELGNLYGCARLAGEVACWGVNNFGQLGDGSTEGKTSPTPSKLCD